MFGGNAGTAGVQNQNNISSDDDIPVGFSRRRRLSSQSSFKNRDFKSIPRKEPDENVEQINQEIERAKQQEEERIH